MNIGQLSERYGSERNNPIVLSAELRIYTISISQQLA